jgi:hypothetical protein
VKLLLEYLIVFWAIASSGAVLFLGYNYETLAIFVLILAIYFTAFNHRLRLKTGYVGIALLAMVMLLIAMLVNNDSAFQLKYFSIIFRIILLATIPLAIRPHKFLKIYSEIMYIIAMLSLIIYVIILLNTGIIDAFGEIAAYGNRQYKNLYFLVIRLPVANFVRNSSIFWEGGAYQAFLVIALAFELHLYRYSRKHRVLLLSVSIFTTFSTTGFILFLLLIFTESIGRHDSVRQKIMKVGTMITLVAVIISTVTFNRVVVEKFNLENTSFAVRVASTATDIEIFKGSPLFGVGHKRYNNLVEVKSWNDYGIFLSGSVNSFTQYMAQYGIINLAILLMLYGLMVKSIPKITTLQKFNISVGILIIFATQNFIVSFIWLEFALLGLYNRQRNFMERGPK